VTNATIPSIKPALDVNLHPEEMPSWMTMLFAIASGLLAANAYYSQPIAELIANSLGLSSSATGLIVAFTQAGFGIGLFLIVPLGDLMENRRLALMLIGVTALALLTTATSAGPLGYLASAPLVGLGSVAVQVLIPFAAHMAPDRIRARVVGNVMSGLMIARAAGVELRDAGHIVACGVLRLGREHVCPGARVGLGTAEAGANRDDLVSRAPEVNEPPGAHNTHPSAAGTLPGLSVWGV
jgi:hypothetical protein